MGLTSVLITVSQGTEWLHCIDNKGREKRHASYMGTCRIGSHGARNPVLEANRV